MTRLLLLLYCLSAGVVAPALAAETEDFTINTTIISTDTIAPTVPTTVAAEVAAADSIQLTWDASSDNVGVTGYHVWRDGVQIATTSMISYLDAGLASSTLYNYYLTAFDASGNESASSSVVSATTPAEPGAVNTVSGTNVAGGIALHDILIDTTTHTATLTFTTERYVYSEIEWGVDGTELGVVRSHDMRKDHQVHITGLQPATEYQLTIRLHTAGQENVVVKTVFAYTKAQPDITPPANPLYLQAVASETGVELTWQNPADGDFSHVRILRNTQFYPSDTVDGWVLYEGSDTTYHDQFTARPVYYTLFAFDTAGNVSSGAVVAVYGASGVGAGGGGTAVPELPDLTPIPDGFTEVPAEQTTWPVYVQQHDRVSRISTSTEFAIAAGVPFTVYVPRAVVPSHLKTIVATLQHPNSASGTFQFLLRRNHDGTAYEATVGALPARGQYQLTIRWFDFANHSSGVVVGALMLTAQPPLTEPTSSSSWYGFRRVTPWVLVLLILRIIYRRLKPRDV